MKALGKIELQACKVQGFCSHFQALELFEKKVQKFQRALSKILRWLCYKVGKFRGWMFLALVFLSYNSWWLSPNWIGRFLRPRFSPFDLVDLTVLDLWLFLLLDGWSCSLLVVHITWCFFKASVAVVFRVSFKEPFYSILGCFCLYLHYFSG